MIKILLTFSMSVFLIGCGQSCEEQGGKLVQDGFVLLPHPMGNGQFIYIQHPKMVCKWQDAPF